MDVKNHDLGEVIARSCKGRIHKTRGTEIQGHEVKVHQFRVKCEGQTLRTESGVDFKSDSGSLGLYLQHVFNTQQWLLRESRETA